MEAGTAAAPGRALANDATEVVGRRMGGQIVDGVLFGIVFLVLGLATGGGHSGGGKVDVTLSGGPFAIWLVLWVGYHAICEGTGGQTLGKRLFKVRVVRSDGSRVGFGPALARNVLRLIDVLPFLYIVGFIAIFATGARRQRIGDLAASTVVVEA